MVRQWHNGTSQPRWRQADTGDAFFAKQRGGLSDYHPICGRSSLFDAGSPSPEPPDAMLMRGLSGCRVPKNAGGHMFMQLWHEGDPQEGGDGPYAHNTDASPRVGSSW